MGDDSLNRVGPEWNGYLGRLSLQGEVRFGENVQGLDTRLGGGGTGKRYSLGEGGEAKIQL